MSSDTKNTLRSPTAPSARTRDSEQRSGKRSGARSLRARARTRQRQLDPTHAEQASAKDRTAATGHAKRPTRDKTSSRQPRSEHRTEPHRAAQAATDQYPQKAPALPFTEIGRAHV